MSSPTTRTGATTSRGCAYLITGISGVTANGTFSRTDTSGTAGEKGSGLGIFLVQELLEKIKGQLLVNSEEGKGSTFSILLPAL